MEVIAALESEMTVCECQLPVFACYCLATGLAPPGVLNIQYHLQMKDFAMKTQIFHEHHV
jgi:hypothetical protein